MQHATGLEIVSLSKDFGAVSASCNCRIMQTSDLDNVVKFIERKIFKYLPLKCFEYLWEYMYYAYKWVDRPIVLTECKLK